MIIVEVSVKAPTPSLPRDVAKSPVDQPEPPSIVEAACMTLNSKVLGGVAQRCACNSKPFAHHLHALIDRLRIDSSKTTLEIVSHCSSEARNDGWGEYLGVQ